MKHALMLDFPMNPTFDEPEEHVGCAATSVPFDCLDGLSMFKKWSAEKRQWLLGAASGQGVQLAERTHAAVRLSFLPFPAARGAAQPEALRASEGD